MTQAIANTEDIAVASSGDASASIRRIASFVANSAADRIVRIILGYRMDRANAFPVSKTHASSIMRLRSGGSSRAPIP
jgi:hypothetical protein